VPLLRVGEWRYERLDSKLMLWTDCRDHATMKVDITPIKHKLKKVKGVDGNDYYRVDFNILAQYHSAHVEYKWEFQGS
jgi:hypothetical protein